MPTAFVTGGSGFIGGALVRRLVADGVGVRALARSDASAVDAGVPRFVHPGTEAALLAGQPLVLADELPLPGRPPLTRLAVWLSGLEATIDISRARTELGYAPVRTVDEGLAELSDEARRGQYR